MEKPRGGRIAAIAGVAVVVIAAVFMIGCCCTRPATQPTAFLEDKGEPHDEPPPGVAAPDSITRTRMRNVHFRIDPLLAMNIRRLEGGMRPKGDVINFGDARSFTIEIVSAEVGMAMPDLLHLLNQYVFNYDGAPLSIFSISTTPEGYLRQTGMVHKIVDIPFEMTSEPSATPEGLIRLHPVAMEICGIPGLPLMKALGIQLDELLDLSGATGVSAEVNDLLLDPTLILPPPAIEGTVTEVRVEGDELVQVFGTGGSVDIPQPSDPSAPNYMFYWGGTLEFGRLFMVRADLQIVDADPSDSFDFFLREYQAQLVAGYSRTMADDGLLAVFPDYDEVGSNVQPTVP